MNIAKKFGTLAYQSLVKQGMVDKLLEEELSSVQDWRFSYELEGGPDVRPAKRKEHPWRPWAEAMIKWSCTPPFKEYFGPFLMRDYCRTAMVETYAAVSASKLKRPWDEMRSEIPDFLMRNEFILSLSRILRPSTLPERFKTREIVNQLALNNDDFISNFKHLIDESTLVTLCAKHGNKFRDLPEELKTDAVLDAAIGSCSWALEFSSEQQRTPDRCLAHVRCNKTLGGVPAKHLTQEMCDIAISYSLSEITSAPEAMVNASSVFNGAVRDPSAVEKYVPKAMITDDFIDRLLRANSRALRELPQDKVTAERVLEAIDRNVINYRELRSHHKTDEVADRMIALRPDSFALLDRSQWTLERAIKVVADFPFALSMVRIEEISDADLLRAVRSDYKVMALLPKARITREMEVEALSQNGDLLKMIDEDLRTPEVCLIALRQSELAWKHIPEWIDQDPAFRDNAPPRPVARKAPEESNSMSR